MALASDAGGADAGRQTSRQSALRMQALRSRERGKALAQAAKQEPRGSDVCSVEAGSFGPLPRESWSGWWDSPVARVHREGFALVLNILDEQDKATLRSKYPDEKNMEGLFGPNLWSTGYVESAAVSRRRTFVLSPQDAPWRDLEAKVRGVLERFHFVGNSHVCSGMSLLLALDRAPRQSFHVDFSKDHALFKRARMYQECLPYPISVLIALDDDTTLTLSDGSLVSIPKFAACVFRGDMRHAGSAYKKKNWRLHLYYGVNRGSRMTTCDVPRRGTKRKGGRHIEVVRANETDS